VSEKLERLPPGWVWTTIGEITWPKIEQTHPAVGTTFTYIDIGSIDNRSKMISNPKILPGENAPSRARQLVREGDVLVAMTRPGLNAVAVVPINLQGSIASTGLAVLRGIETEPGWILANVRSDNFIKVMVSQVQGALYPAVRPKSIREFRISLPPRSEQIRIVKRLEELLGRCQAIREALENIHPLLTSMKDSLFDAAFSGNLTASWRKRNARTTTAEDLLLRSDKERKRRTPKLSLPQPSSSASTKLAQQADNPEIQVKSDAQAIPPNWRWTRLVRIAELRGGITKNTKRRADIGTRDVPYLRVANVQRGFLNLSDVKYISVTEDEISQYKLFPGDVLFNEGGDRDKVGRGWVWSGELDECIHQNHIFRARLYLKEIEPKLLSWYGNSLGKTYFIENSKQTTNLASISISNLSLLPIPLPPAAEQKEMVRLIEESLTFIAKITTTCLESAQRLDRLEQRLTNMALTGRLASREAFDEDSSVLLKRIKREWNSLNKIKTHKPRRNDAEPMNTPANLIPETLADIIRSHKPGISPEELWRATKLDIDDFYAALKHEIALGIIKEVRHGNSSLLELA